VSRQEPVGEQAGGKRLTRHGSMPPSGKEPCLTRPGWSACFGEPRCLIGRRPASARASPPRLLRRRTAPHDPTPCGCFVQGGGVIPQRTRPLEPTWSA
jgi:hypothetical protein